MNSDVNNDSNKKNNGFNLTRLISDLGPAIAFFIGYIYAQKTHQQNPILFATYVFLPAVIAGFAYSWHKEKRLSPIGVFTFIMILVFSGLAIWLKNDIFIKMRPTIVYTIMGSILIVSVVIKQNVLKTLFDGALHLPEDKWRTLSMNAGIMYLILAVLNEIIWRIYAPFSGAPKESIWVTYNMWGDFSINMIFWIASMIFLAKYMTDSDGKPLLEEEGQ